MSANLHTVTQPMNSQGGVALLEALVAILIFSIGILGLIGLQAISMQSTTTAKSRIDASFVANERIGDAWGGDLANLTSMEESDTDVSSRLPDGKRTTVVDGNTVTVTVSWKVPSESERQTYSTVAVISSPNGP